MTTKAKRKKNWMGKPRQVSLTIGVYPEELTKWKAAAKLESRSLSQWIRLHLAGDVFKTVSETIVQSLREEPEPNQQ